MKRIILYLLFIGLCPCACFATFGDADDGFLTAGEYDYSAWLEDFAELIVMGGGAYEIVAKDYSYLEVQYTSTPLGFGVGGIMDILLDDHSDLLYLDGLTEEITISENATAILKGGRIDYIRSMQHVSNIGNITIESQLGWSWIEGGSDITGITGLWANGDAFTINFFDDGTDYYDPTWENINVVIIPEPATLALFGIGGLLLRRKKS